MINLYNTLLVAAILLFIGMEIGRPEGRRKPVKRWMEAIGTSSSVIERLLGIEVITAKAIAVPELNEFVGNDTDSPSTGFHHRNNGSPFPTSYHVLVLIVCSTIILGMFAAFGQLIY